MIVVKLIAICSNIKYNKYTCSKELRKKCKTFETLPEKNSNSMLIVVFFNV